jgi:hypothetical protein
MESNLRSYPMEKIDLFCKNSLVPEFIKLFKVFSEIFISAVQIVL